MICGQGHDLLRWHVPLSHLHFLNGWSGSGSPDPPHGNDLGGKKILEALASWLMLTREVVSNGSAESGWSLKWRAKQELSLAPVPVLEVQRVALFLLPHHFFSDQTKSGQGAPTSAPDTPFLACPPHPACFLLLGGWEHWLCGKGIGQSLETCKVLVYFVATCRWWWLPW